MLFFKRLSMIGAVIVVGLVSFTGSVSAADSLVVTAHVSCPAGGSYIPEFVVVMWIENATNTFQRTFRMLGNQTVTNDLPIWNSKNGGVKTIDGSTGATLSSMTTVRGAWNLNGSAGTRVANGTYKLNIEVSSAHNSSALVQSSVVIGATSTTKTGVDSSKNSGSTYVTNLSAVFTTTGTAVNSPAIVNNITQSPLLFTVPANFSGMATARLIAADGRIIWQKSYNALSGNSLVLSATELRTATKTSGVAILEADFGTSKVSRPYFMSR